MVALAINAIKAVAGSALCARPTTVRSTLGTLIVLRTGEAFPTALRVANAIEVQYVTGYTSQYNIPEPMRLGILQHIAYLYEHRGDMYDVKFPYPPMLRSLYAPYVVHRGMGSSSLMSLG